MMPPDIHLLDYKDTPLCPCLFPSDEDDSALSVSAGPPYNPDNAPSLTCSSNRVLIPIKPWPILAYHALHHSSFIPPLVTSMPQDTLRVVPPHNIGNLRQIPPEHTCTLVGVDG